MFFRVFPGPGARFARKIGPESVPRVAGWSNVRTFVVAGVRLRLTTHSPAIPPVLVVDDQADDTYLLRRALGKAGVKNPVTGCASAEEAIEFLTSAKFGGVKPCLVLLDINMPRMNGFELLRWIRSQPELKSLRVAMLTSSALDRDRERARAEGADDYLIKFPPAEKLAAVVREAG